MVNDVMARIINNIKFIIDNSDFKIGRIEKEAGVSTGYLSRKISDTISDGMSEGVSMNFVYAFSKHTGISIDVLVDHDLQVEFASVFEYVACEKTIADAITKIQNILVNTRDDKLYSNLSSASEYLNKAVELAKKQTRKISSEQLQILDKLSVHTSE